MGFLAQTSETIAIGTVDSTAWSKRRFSSLKNEQIKRKDRKEAKSAKAFSAIFPFILCLFAPLR
jgi:hypothetical protein